MTLGRRFSSKDPVVPGSFFRGGRKSRTSMTVSVIGRRKASKGYFLNCQLIKMDICG